MSDYTLYYWQLPFRGQFIRALLAYAGKSWDEKDDGGIGALMDKAPGEQPIAFIGPPVLVDNDTGFALAQMPAIAFYLSDTLDLMPPTPQGRALSLKVFNDANDVIDEITLDGGREMWTDKRWDAFVPRLEHWMAIFEDTARRNDMSADSGFLLGTDRAQAADVVTATLWHMLASRFPAIGTLLARTAPATAGLVRRMMAEEALAKLQEDTDRKWPDQYCGGQIEASMKKAINGE